jgi:hypothetical protein
MGGAPQVGFSATVRKINSRICLEILPPPPTRFCTLQSMVQYSLNPAWCHRATVSGRTRKSDFSQSDQMWRTTTQNSLSNAPSFGLGCLRFNTASCWRSARFSNSRLRCARKMRITAPHQSRNRLNMAATVADWLPGCCAKLLISQPDRIVARDTLQRVHFRRQRTGSDSQFKATAKLARAREQAEASLVCQNLAATV